MSEVQNYVLAEQDYLSGMKYKDIASKYGVTVNTVKSWKTRYKWSKKGVHTKSKKVCTQNKKACAEKRAAIAEDVEQVIRNPDLTDKQRLFCLHYVRCFNATKAYQKAYKVDYTTAASIGYRLLEKDGVRKEIQRLKMNRLNREMLDESDIFQKYLDIAFADITDFVEFGSEDVTFTDKNGEERIIKISTVNIKNDNEVDGTLISEISKGKDGVKVKLSDRLKAMAWVAEHMNLATDEQKARIEQMRANTERLKQNRDGDDFEDGVEIINDAPKETGEDIGHRDPEISSSVQ